MVHLLVPIRLDALRVTGPLSVVRARADFTRLPYWDGKQEINPDVANISEDIVSHPFQDQALQLAPGIHLHWALPIALARGEARAPRNDGTSPTLSFPAVPDRWLVTRHAGDQRKAWLVESDYVFPDAQSAPGSISIPFPAAPKNGRPQPFRHLGRTLPYSPPWREEPAAEYLSKLGYRLTAVGYQPEPGTNLTGGYSEPSFAAFYPNCASVFGLHDPDPPQQLAGVTYEVIGWYAHRTQDFLHLLLMDLQQRLGRSATLDEVRAAVQAHCGWQMDKGATSAPEAMVCYARITMSTSEVPSAALPDRAVKVAVGNTATEALSAYLAQEPTLSTDPSTLEEQLEALHLAAGLQDTPIDLGPKFKQARHSRGFAAVPGGTLWTVRKAEGVAATHAQSAPREELALPFAVAHALNQLNLCQEACDKASFELESMQRQLFADWYKSMLCAYPPDDTRDDYPDIDQVRYFIQAHGVRAIQAHRDGLAELASCKAAVEQQLDAWHQATQLRYELQARPAPRFYRPQEPVLLLVDDSTTQPPLRASQRHERTEPVCSVLDGASPLVEALPALQDKLLALEKAAQKPAESGFFTWSGQPWNPFVLEWLVELSPLSLSGNLDPSTRAFARNFIEANYTLAGAGFDLTLQKGRGGVQKAASLYAGSSVLTPNAKLALEERLRDFLKNHGGESDSAHKTVQTVFDFISRDGFHALAQSLNGFNEALLMRRQTLQLPVDDPLGFGGAVPFTQEVRKALKQRPLNASQPSTTSAPQPLDDFHPIRTGVFQILALRLVDTFGRVQKLTLDAERVRAIEVMADAVDKRRVVLPPRLSQPARVAFRWLAAQGDQVEMNTHPATTPICGWLLPNHLDGSLMAYDAEGMALGSIAPDVTAGKAQWRPPPGLASALELQNPHLRAVIAHMLGLSAPALATLFQSIENALQHIDPASTAHQDSLALLMGRPLAVVRASLKLELKGLPAVNQGWDAFRRDLHRHLQREGAPTSGPAARETDGVPAVRFPVRLGDDQQLDDGLAGYWIERRANASVSPEPGADTLHEGFVPASASSLLWMALSDEPATLTMLVDPRGQVHASTGILPTKAIGIPPDQYAQALKALRVTFLSTPILSSAQSVALPLPSEHGYAWSWVEKTGAEWTRSAIGQADLHASWADRLEIREGWLELSSAGDNERKQS